MSKPAIVRRVFLSPDASESAGLWYMPAAVGDNPERNIQIVESVIDGSTYRETGERFGVHPETVRSIVRKFCLYSIQGIRWLDFPRGNSLPQQVRAHRGWLLRVIAEHRVNVG